MKLLQAWFISRVAREKFLLLAFVLLGVAIWASSLLGRGQVWYADFAATRSELDDQAFWLGRRASIEEAAKQAIARLDLVVERTSVGRYSPGIVLKVGLGAHTYSRIQRQLMNIVSSLVTPLHLVDFYEERGVDDQEPPSVR